MAVKKEENVLSEQQIYDYIDCPVKYAILHQDSIPVPEQVSMNILLHRVANAFCLSLLNGIVQDQAWLKKKWDMYARKYKHYLNDKRVLMGMRELSAFWKYCQRTELQIVDVQSQFTIGFPSAKVRGVLGAVALRNNKLELFIPDFSPKSPDQSILDLKLQYTMHCYAFRTLYQRELSGIHIAHIHTGKEYYTYRKRDDYLRLETTVESVARAIRQRIYYPRENVLCPLCKIKDLCRSWVA